MAHKIIDVAEKRGDFVVIEDGRCVWWPQNNGFLSAESLRILADELDRRNNEKKDNNETIRS